MGDEHEHEDGHIALSDKSGLGIELDEDVVGQRLCAGDWDTPRLYHDDGAVANW